MVRLLIIRSRLILLHEQAGSCVAWFAFRSHWRGTQTKSRQVHSL